MSVDPIATVIICTRDRSASLARTLGSLVDAARRVDQAWELVVVDNGSSDDTAEVIRGFSDRLPVRYVHQPIAGLSNARNAGVAASTGRYVVWTDDDVLVDEGWLAAYFAAFAERPGDAVFGGRTEPVLEEPHQPWFKANAHRLGSLLAVRDEPSWREVTVSQVPYGLNYAIRGEEQRRHFYDPELGVAPGRRRGGEEVAVIRAILAEGGRGSWVWDATVYHLIPAARQTEDYIIQFYTALSLDHPLFTRNTGLMARAVAAARSIVKYVRSDWHYRRARKRGGLEAATPWLILRTRAAGSLARYIKGVS